jgi:predicted transcriptional regulator
MTPKNPPKRPRTTPKPASDARLPDAELELLSCLHAAGEAEASELRRTLESQRPLSHASVVTLLGRLQARGLVDRRKADSGKAFVYFPTRAADPKFRGITGRLLERVFHNDTVSMVSSLFGAKPPTRTQLDQLRKLIDDTEAAAVGRSRRRGQK